MKRRGFLVSLVALAFTERAVDTLALSGIGSEAGNKAARFLGGLFDNNNRKVSANTESLRLLSKAMLNAPNGYRIELYRYRSADPKEIARDFREYRR